ncbi:uncharacterized protein LOC115676348 [Syzygium oleosum]|uniref:uncharacterized protein LOC115676348 n=1 Tax=Syzygium oleosum TaxID=219896 RepID=UPI0024BB927B|nr:uncharacterized protein LOC115676348 [Syzygium oleosum]
MASRDQALSLLAAANNHGDLAVKLSSLRQARDILLSIDSSLASELLPYLAELQSSPEGLVRKSLVETIEELGLKMLEHSCVLMPVLLAYLRDVDSVVAKQCIISGTKIFCRVLEEMAVQLNIRGKIERWLEDIWLSMLKFRDNIVATAMEPGVISTRLLALKFLERYVLLFTPDNNELGKPLPEGGQVFNISRLTGSHSIIDPVLFVSEAGMILEYLLDMLSVTSSLPGCLAIAVINCLASIGRKRLQHFSTVFSALLAFDSNCETGKGYHAASVRYSLRTAFLGFLRCTSPAILESRERLLGTLRAMNAGDAAEQVIRQMEKLARNAERASRDARLVKEDHSSSQMSTLGSLIKKRPISQDEEMLAHNLEVASKRGRYIADNNSTFPGQQTADSGHGSTSANGVSPNVSMLNGDLSPVEQMIAMIGALLAEGERGAESLEILISKIHPDLLADIVITNMKHLPKIPPPLTRLGKSEVTGQLGSASSPVQVTAPSFLPANSIPSPMSVAQIPYSTASITSESFPETSIVSSVSTDSKRDPRRDPRRQDPRLAVPPEAALPTVDDSGDLQSKLDDFNSNKPQLSVMVGVKTASSPLISKKKSDDEILGSSLHDTSELIPKEEVQDGFKETKPTAEVGLSSDVAFSSEQITEDDIVKAEDMQMAESETPTNVELDQCPSAVANIAASEETGKDLPVVPSYIELNGEQEANVRKLLFKQIIESCKHPNGKECGSTAMSLIARLVAQSAAADDLVGMLKNHILEDYQLQKGHELVLEVLYYLHSISGSDSAESSAYAVTYDKFLLEVAESLLLKFPASDKSLSRLLGEAPVLPSSVLKLLDDLCNSDIADYQGKSLRDADRVTQGLNAVWSLILGRPHYRQSCLDIALKCALHSQEEIRAKAIRLVANKLFQLSYVAETIEHFAKSMLFSAVNQNASDVEVCQPGSNEQPDEGKIGSHNTSGGGSQVPFSEAATFESESMGGAQPLAQGISSLSLSEAQRLVSLFFALCMKKPSLLSLLFDTYGQAPRPVKQAVHRHIPILIRAFGSSYSELLQIISDPPQGSENLLMLVLQILTEETVPSPDLITTVKHLYETKLKDVSILIPMLPSFSKSEVLPIFPRLVNLPPEKFQKALAHILQGSAHTGPALTPAEVLVAIHDIVPEKDGVPLKKVMDACSTCFEQRTVFTQQVLARALHQMVDRTPLPLLFMRTVIQAIDAFPALVDFVMEILSKLVSKQVWKMPKLWVGFLKCVSQTQPHSFGVLLQLPPPQLESSLTKYANLREPLAAFASQPNIRASLPRTTLSVLGLTSETVDQPHVSSSLTSGTSSSVHGTTMT